MINRHNHHITNIHFEYSCCPPLLLGIITDVLIFMYIYNYLKQVMIILSFLTYAALQVQVTTITVHQSYMEAELKCLSSCSPAGRISYVWFKNGQKMMKEEIPLYSGQFNPGDNISCALKGHEDYRSPSVCEYSSLCQSVFLPKLNIYLSYSELF